MSAQSSTTQQQHVVKKTTLGPGTYDVEHGVDFVKFRNPSPVKMNRQSDRSPARERESVSPDHYNPRKEVTQTQSPQWTFGVKRPGDSAFSGADSNLGPGSYEASSVNRRGAKSSAFVTKVDLNSSTSRTRTIN